MPRFSGGGTSSGAVSVLQADFVPRLFDNIAAAQVDYIPKFLSKNYYHAVLKVSKAGAVSVIALKLNNDAGAKYSQNNTTDGVTVNFSGNNNLILYTTAGLTTVEVIIDLYLYKDESGNYIGQIWCKSRDGTASGSQCLITFSTTITVLTSLVFFLGAGNFTDARVLQEVASA